MNALDILNHPKYASMHDRPIVVAIIEVFGGSAVEKPNLKPTQLSQLYFYLI